MLIVKIIIIALSVIAPVANASFIDENSKPLPETNYRKCASEFCAELVVTHNDQVALRNWNTPSKGVYFPTTENIKKGQIISAFIVFNKCGQTISGNCQITQTMKIIQPDGGTYSSIPESEVWYEKEAPEGDSIGLSVDFIRLIVEPHEQLGKYTFDVVVKDYVSGKTVTLSKSINVVK